MLDRTIDETAARCKVSNAEKSNIIPDGMDGANRCLSSLSDHLDSQGG